MARPTHLVARLSNQAENAIVCGRRASRFKSLAGSTLSFLAEDAVSPELAEAVQRGLRTVLVLAFDAGAGKWNGPELLQISSADRSNPNAYRFARISQPH